MLNFVSRHYFDSQLQIWPHWATGELKFSSKKVIQKIAEATGGFISDKIAKKITKISKNSQQNDSETVTNEYNKEILKERYTSPEERLLMI